MGSLAEANATTMPVGPKAGAVGWAVNGWCLYFAVLRIDFPLRTPVA
jgi:hypothetical protein